MKTQFTDRYKCVNRLILLCNDVFMKFRGKPFHIIFDFYCPTTAKLGTMRSEMRNFDCQLFVSFNKYFTKGKLLLSLVIYCLSGYKAAKACGLVEIYYVDYSLEFHTRTYLCMYMLRGNEWVCRLEHTCDTLNGLCHRSGCRCPNAK